MLCLSVALWPLFSTMLGIVCALKIEAPRLENALVVISGPGLANARRAAEQLAAREDITGLVSAGYAGALSPDLGVGDLVVDTEKPAWRSLAGEHGARLARIATVDYIVGSIAERAFLARETGAVAVDMESSAVAEIARRHGLPFAGVRAITDTTARDLAIDWNRCRGVDGRFLAFRVVREALRSPQGIAEIRQFWYASRLASRSLARMLAVLAMGVPIRGHGALT